MKPMRARLRGLLHTVLTQVAEQVLVQQEDGTYACAPMLAWKEHYRRRFLGEGVSTEDVKQVSDSRLQRFILEIESAAATERGVTFTNRSRP